MAQSRFENTHRGSPTLRSLHVAGRQIGCLGSQRRRRTSVRIALNVKRRQNCYKKPTKTAQPKPKASSKALARAAARFLSAKCFIPCIQNQAERLKKREEGGSDCTPACFQKTNQAKKNRFPELGWVTRKGTQV